MRTLRHYEQIGLLTPTEYTPSGQRLYTDADLVTLQQILALKFLGFSLQEVRGYLLAGPQQLREVLATQKTMLREKRARLDGVIRAIEALEQCARAGQPTWEEIVNVIEVIQMEKNNDWVRKYFTPEQLQTMQELNQQSYSDAAQRKMEDWGYGVQWTEEDQRRVDEEYAFIAAGLQRLVAEQGDLTGPEAQDLARRKLDLERQFTQGDQDIAEGLRQWWANYAALPAEDRPFPRLWGEAEDVFLNQAVEWYLRQQDAS